MAARPQKLSDRRDERQRDDDGFTKPTVLTRKSVRFASVLSLLLIVYGTLGPLGIALDGWLRMPTSWSWVPAWEPTDRNDVFTNLMVYLPVGLALRLLIRRRGAAGLGDFLAAMFATVLLSYGTELLQQFMPARVSNGWDIVFNTIGAAVGALFAPYFQQTVRNTHAKVFSRYQTNSWGVLAIMTGVVTSGLMVIPLDFTTPSVEIELDRDLDLVDVRRFGMFLVLGFALYARAAQRALRPASALRASIGAVAFMSMGLELAQISLASHECGLLDIFIAFLGGAAGCGVAWKFVEGGLIRAAWLADAEEDPGGITLSPRVKQTLVYGALVAGLLALYIVSIDAAQEAVKRTESLTVRWIPFQAHFMMPFHKVIAHVIQAVTLYLFLSLLSLAFGRGFGGLLGLLLVMGLSVLIEAYTMFRFGSVADVTGPLLALAGWFLAQRCWRAMQLVYNPADKPHRAAET